MPPVAPGYQPLLARLLSDPALIAELHADPEAFAAEHNVDRHLADQIRGLDPARLRISARLISVRNRRHTYRSLPASADLMNRLEHEDEAVRSAVERVRPRAARDGADFAERLAKLAGLLPTTWPALVLREIIRFELIWRDLRERLPGQAPPVSGSLPLMRPRLMTAAFELPAARVCRRILAGQSFADVVMGKTHYVLSEEDGLTRISAVPLVLYDILRLCDGTKSTDEIAICLDLPSADVERVLGVARAKNFLI